MRKMWLRLFCTDFEESASRQPWHCKVIVIAFHFAKKEDEFEEDVIAFLFCSKEHFEGGKDLQRFWGWFGGKWFLFAKILRKMWLCFFLQRFWGWFWGKSFCKDFEENASRQPWQFHLGSQKQSPRRRAEKMQNQSPDSFILVTKKDKIHFASTNPCTQGSL